jgi:hypothetical protein
MSGCAMIHFKTSIAGLPKTNRVAVFLATSFHDARMTMMQIPPIVWRPLEGYAASHCDGCKGGWIRKNSKGLALAVCLLDRLPIPTDLADCDHHKPKETELTEEVI